jgi:hypothetical protein
MPANQEDLLSKILDARRTLLSISAKLKIAVAEVKELNDAYYSLWKFKDKLERQLITPKVFKLKKPKKEPEPVMEGSPLDVALNALQKCSASQVRALLAELQGSSEEGNLIEYEDEPETFTIEEEQNDD